MNPVILAVLSLRAAALAATIAGQPATGNALYALADLVESGVATDEHMREVAEKLKDRELTQDDWDEVRARIVADSARLRSG
jgi:hypothetical protein